MPATAQNAEASAAKAFSKAEALASKGSYSKAHASYKRIAKKWPNTAAGELALTRSGKTAFLGWTYLVENGPSENRVDVVIAGDAFKLSEQNRFDDMAKQIPTHFKSREVFEEYYAHHNFIRINVASKDGNIDSHGRAYDTAFDGKMMGRNEPFFMVSRNRVMEALMNLPSHDELAIVMTKAKGMGGTGGRGVAACGSGNPGLINHEWGHSFGRLSDEYTTYTHDRGESVRNSVNISNTGDKKKVPWAHWLEAKAPGVGVYRGGAGRIKGAWRSNTTQCIMSQGREFCTVCREALVLRIYRYVDPIDESRPAAQGEKKQSSIRAERDGRYRFEVDLVQPKKHGLEVCWYVFPEDSAPKTIPFKKLEDRAKRGKLPKLDAKHAARSHSFSKKTYKFLWRPERNAKGKFRVVCRVKDHAKVSAERLPWVLKDEKGLLESERVWVVQL